MIIYYDCFYYIVYYLFIHYFIFVLFYLSPFLWAQLLCLCLYVTVCGNVLLCMLEVQCYMFFYVLFFMFDGLKKNGKPNKSNWIKKVIGFRVLGISVVDLPKRNGLENGLQTFKLIKYPQIYKTQCKMSLCCPYWDVSSAYFTMTHSVLNDQPK